MQKQKLILVCFFALFLMTAVTIFAGDAWFDMENCSMCKPMMDKPGLMENMTWEQYDISNGVVGVTTVAAEFKDAFKSCHTEMMAISEKLMAGEEMPLCGSCVTFGGLVGKGMHIENVPTSNGQITILTADNDELVAEIKAWSSKNKEEMKKMSMTEK